MLMLGEECDLGEEEPGMVASLLCELEGERVSAASLLLCELEGEES